MAERVVKVKLSAVVDEYNKGMREAANATRTVGTESEKLAQTRQSMQMVGGAAVAMGASIGAGIGVAIAKYAEFDQAISYVAATGEDARDNLDALRDAAMEAGASTVFSATESANAVEELAKAGLDAADILGGGLAGSLDLAAAGGLGVAEAAAIASTTLNQFQLEGSDASHVADLLAAGAGKAMGDVTDLGGALNQAGLVASQFGLSVDETVGTLSAFASAGMLGSDAGTSMRTMLLRLANPTKEVQTLMKGLGIEAYDAGGNFVGLAGLAGELETGLQGMTQAQKDQTLAMIFGQDAIRGANILLREGAAGIEEWTEKVDDQGYAAETAATRLDNLKGDWEALTGAVDSALIGMGEGADGPLRALVQTATDLTTGFTQMPPWLQQTTLGLSGLAGAATLGVGAFLLAIPKIAEYRAALETMGVGAQRAGRAIETVGKAAGAAALFVGLTLAVAKTAEAFGMANEGAKGYQETLKILLDQDYDGAFSGIEGDVTDMASAFDLLLGGSGAIERFGSGLNGVFGGTLPDQVRDTREQFSLMGQALAEMVNRGDAEGAAERFREITKAAEEQGYTVNDVKSLLPEYQEALDGVKNSSTLTEGAVDGASESFVDMGDAAAEAEDLVDSLREALDAIGRSALNMGEAQDQAQSAINSLTDSLEVEGATLFDTNDASIALRDSLREVEDSHRTSAEAMIDNGLSADEATAAYYRGRDALLDQIQGFFASREEAAVWADANLGSAQQVEQGIRDLSAQISAIPQPAPINLSVTGSSEVYDELMRVQDALRSVTGDRSLHVSTGQGGQGGLVAGNATGGYYSGGVKEFAAGGYEPGIYPYQPGGIHKFAEEYDEAYISMDPARIDRSRGVWTTVGERMGFMGSAQPSTVAPAQVNVTVTSKGGIDLLRYVDIQVEQANDSLGSSLRGL